MRREWLAREHRLDGDLTRTVRSTAISASSVLASRRGPLYAEPARGHPKAANDGRLKSG